MITPHPLKAKLSRHLRILNECRRVLAVAALNKPLGLHDFFAKKLQLVFAGKPDQAALGLHRTGGRPQDATGRLHKLQSQSASRITLVINGCIVSGNVVIPCRHARRLPNDQVLLNSYKQYY